MNAARMVAIVLGSLALQPLAGVAQAGDEKLKQKFGKTLVATYTVPRETLDQFNALKPYAADPKLSTLENFVARQSKGWRASQPVQLSSKANPYRVAIRFEGEVTGDAGAVTLWSGGWFRESSAQQGEGEIATPLAGLNVSAAEGKRGTRVARAGAAGPISFRYDGVGFPTIDLNRLEGMRLDRVEVEVWSGIADASWKEVLFGWQGALAGVVMLTLWFVGFRRRG